MPDPILYGKGSCCRIHIDTHWDHNPVPIHHQDGVLLVIQDTHSVPPPLVLSGSMAQWKLLDFLCFLNLSSTKNYFSQICRHLFSEGETWRLTSTISTSGVEWTPPQPSKHSQTIHCQTQISNLKNENLRH